jgi:D-sedoheptulose 7-phosphate isomerase
MRQSLEHQIRDSIKVKQALLDDGPTLTLLEQLCFLFSKQLSDGNKIIFAGNGGSAADSQHLAAEFVSRFDFDRPSLSAIALTTDTSMLTAIGNDYGYEYVFSRQLQAQARPGDVFVGITTSGKSRNVLRAFEECKRLSISSVALCGQGGDINKIVDYCVRVPSNQTARIQECHILIGHLICSQVERLMFPELAEAHKPASH